MVIGRLDQSYRIGQSSIREMATSCDRCV